MKEKRRENMKGKMKEQIKERQRCKKIDFCENVSEPSSPPDELAQNISKKNPSRTNYSSFFVSKIQNDSNSIFRAGGINSEGVRDRTALQTFFWWKHNGSNMSHAVAKKNVNAKRTQPFLKENSDEKYCHNLYPRVPLARSRVKTSTLDSVLVKQCSAPFWCVLSAETSTRVTLQSDSRYMRFVKMERKAQEHVLTNC